MNPPAHTRLKNFQAFLFAILLVVSGCQKQSTISQPEVPAVEALVQHSAEFQRQVIQVDSQIYVAIGYGLANSIMITGADGRIIIDAMESMNAAEEVRAAFDSINASPIRGLIYTHHHSDHILGAKAFVEDTSKVKVISHESLPFYMDRVVSVIRPIIEKRAYRMFGNFLDDEGRINAGIGSRLRVGPEETFSMVRPNVMFGDSMKMTIAGIELVFFHAPGETMDQLMVWMPSTQTLFCGDNFYRAFPNLYTIRGTSYRDVNLWKHSLDHMRRLKPTQLVPSHSQPKIGQEKIFQALTDYRDAIQYVHDQTVRWMNQGLTPNEIAHKVILPPHLAEKPYLKEFYGKMSWSVKSVFDGYMGHFDGNATTLQPLARDQHAARMVDLAGGKEEYLQRIQEGLDGADFQWVLELTDHLLVIDPANEAARIARIAALRELAERESNPNARHYYLTEALEWEGLALKAMVKPTEEMAHQVPLARIFESLAVRLVPERCLDVEMAVEFRFPDIDETWSVQIRKGVSEYQPFGLKQPEVIVTVDSDVWKEIAAGLRNGPGAFLGGDIQIEGGVMDFRTFMGYFDR
ncbi:alkyl sulfatase dimerization domain-containing protein [Pontibacter sp. G13]|uniref:alkyl sulfatase dimerization domain-containing protein n=1 Tax=Pontibacter sp. G13 TaxID=3074898 RepID=UPI002888FF84|nr:alkyl sulfatase dimerization domain-containing protein [Pontibacter sp. G13]WNJ21131.1 alkyl sulfatase dimerization domain-containing protein [Pontibacter sp. G13]